MSEEAKNIVTDCINVLSTLDDWTDFEDACSKLTELLSEPNGTERKFKMCGFLIDCIREKL